MIAVIRSAFAAIFVFGLASPISAQVVVYSTGFSAPTYTDGVLNPGTDTTTPGQDGWINSSGGGTNNITVSNSAINGLVSLTTSGQDVRRPFSGNVSANSGSVWLDAHVTVSAAQATGDYALHLSDGGTSNFYARTYFKSSGTGFVMALGTSSGTVGLVYGTTVLPFGVPTHVLARYDFVTGAGNDTGALFINPTTADGSGDTPYVAATLEGTDATSIAAVAMRQGTAANAATMTVDDLQVFATNPVPEPSTLALLGVAGLAALVRRRRTNDTAA